MDGDGTTRRLPAHLARELETARRRNGWSYRDLARLTGLSVGMCHYCCVGERLPSREVAAVLLGVLDVDPWVVEEVMSVAAVRGSPEED